jgi:hypothetical protein
MSHFKMSYAAPSNFTLHGSVTLRFPSWGRSVAAHHDCFHYRQQFAGANFAKLRSLGERVSVADNKSP